MSKSDILDWFSDNTQALQTGRILFILAVSVAVGIIIFLTYRLSYRGVAYSAVFNVSNVVLVMISATIMLMISSNIAIPLGMVGALSIVRFRTAIKDPQDTVYIFWAVVDVGFRIGNGENQRTVKLYLNGKEGYVFLPSYAKLSKLTAEFDEQAFSVSIDGRGIGSGETIADIRADETYDMSITVKAGNAADGGAEAQDGKKTNAVLAVMQGGDAVAETETPQVKTYDMYELTFMKSANRPALYIDTADGTMDYLNQDKANEEPGDMLCLTENGELDSYGAIRKIHGRGNSSWGNIQKGYTFHMEKMSSPLGMQSAKKWLLIANGYD